ncbi:M23 family metallopeptidase [Sphingomonas sp. NSE70-1]|uniref:M23 family metallopeptidase n=1 Tax=Sphingomonas caseinilyticus TaxID=2908205 RepID=A0ABT0RXH4_9SPHN|nr:M23 family metallopeptidase [Sphingomonas caseinilyticus]
MQKAVAGAAIARIRRYFPEREFIMRSEGHVRYLRISSRLQMSVAAVAAGLLLAWVATMASVAIGSVLDSYNAKSLLNREAKVVSAENRIAAYRKNVDAVAVDLDRRQLFIEKMVKSYVGDLPADAKAGETVSDSSQESSKTVDKVSMTVPEAAALAQVEARQLAFAERLTRFADRRSAAAEAAMRKLGLNPQRMLASLDDRSAMGGPFIALTSNAGAIDPRFRRLGLSLARMDALQRGLEGIPQVIPAAANHITSGFGYRSDPFAGQAAFHAGLDFKGPMGAPIFSAANGKVAFVGRRPGYGNSIDIDHGNGLHTRYAHMSAFRARPGQVVTAGQVIGAVGNTGRSTGPHLHFEVRLNGQPVNPRPFLEVAPNVLQEARLNRPAVG